MIRKYADRTEWGRIVEKNLTVVRKNTIGFSGTVALIEMIQVRPELHASYEAGQIRLCVAASGYKWLQQYPEFAHYVVTGMYDREDNIVQWVVMICKSKGLTAGQIPWHEDLHLQLVMLPDGALYIKDADRLEEAVSNGDLTQDDYKLAWQTANQVMEEHRRGSFDMLLLSHQHLEQLLEE